MNSPILESLYSIPADWLPCRSENLVTLNPLNVTLVVLDSSIVWNAFLLISWNLSHFTSHLLVWSSFLMTEDYCLSHTHRGSSDGAGELAHLLPELLAPGYPDASASHTVHSRWAPLDLCLTLSAVSSSWGRSCPLPCPSPWPRRRACLFIEGTRPSVTKSHERFFDSVAFNTSSG